MKKVYRLALSLLIIAITAASAKAQMQDTSHLNLGRVALQKQFTQQYTIKAAYLQNMPFANLTEALQPWLYGFYTSNVTLVYVVDGNIVPDINVYSIYDIEDITLVQNAAIQLNGATNQAQLMVVNTKRNHKNKQGISIAAQTFLVSNNHYNPNTKTSYSAGTGLYHQYNIAAYGQVKNLQYNVSVNYLRDVLPDVNADSVHTKTPLNLNRFRLNGSLAWQINSHNTLTVNVNYTPQNSAENQDISVNPAFSPYKSQYSQDFGEHDHFFSASVSLHSQIAKGLTNTINAGYYSLQDHGNVNYLNISLYNGATADSSFTLAGFTGKYRTKFISNHTSWSVTVGNWQIEPAIDFRYTQEEETITHRSISGQYGGLNTSGYWDSARFKPNIFLLTPSITLSYKKIASLQAGVLKNLSYLKQHGVKRTLLFATAGFNMLEAMHANNGGKLSVYASYAQSGSFNNSYALPDFAGTGSGQFIPATTFLIYGSSLASISLPSPLSQDTWIAEGGIDWASKNKRWYVSYNYEYRTFNNMLQVLLPVFGNMPPTATIYRLMGANTHRIAVNVQALSSGDITWFTGVNASTLYIRKSDQKFFEFAVSSTAISDNGAHTAITGGWVNRLQYKQFSFGLDVMYYIDHYIFFPGIYSVQPPIPAQKTVKSTVIVPNIFAQYNFKKAVVYIESKNMLQGKQFATTNGNKYYGVGVRIDIDK